MKPSNKALNLTAHILRAAGGASFLGWGVGDSPWYSLGAASGAAG